MKRIHLCLLIITTLTAACAGPATTAAPAEAPTAAPTGPLVVLDWSGYELPEFWQPFADKYPDVTVDFSFFAEDAEAFAKLQTGFQSDLVHPCSSWWKLYVDNGLVQPIDTSKLSNWPGIRPEFAKEGQFDGKQYFVPWEWGYESIIVRTDKVKTIPQSWADLWKPEYAGHVALWDSGESNHAMAALALGFDPWNTTPEQEEQIKQKLIEIKPNLVTYWVDFTEVPLLLSSGDAWVVANTWQDAYKSLVDEGVPVEYITPKEGRLGWVCGYGISSKARNVDLAYEYINAAIAPQSMANMSNEYAYGAANADALPLTDESYVKIMQLDQPDIIQRTVFFQSLTSEQQQAFTSLWDEVKAAP
ncbi:MAG: extracellular solute-binding protein [Chloroflexi bacterium]|nr:extracellular solute-binding protein [Chloroflexota bacterium]